MADDLGARPEQLGTSLKIYFVGTAAVKVLGLVRSVAFGRLLGPKEFGVFVLCYGLVVILEPIATLGLSASLLRFSKSAGDARRTLTIGTASSFGLSALLLLFVPQIARILKLDDTALVALTVASLVPYGFYHLLYCSYQGLRSFFKAVLVQLTYVSIFTFGGVAAFALIKPGASVAMGSHIAGGLVAALLAMPLLRAKGGGKPSFAARTVLLYGLFTIAIDMGFEAYRYVDRYVINWYLDSAQVGNFSAAYTLATIPLTLGAILGETLLPHLSAVFDRGDKDAAVGHINLFAKLVAVAGIFVVGAAAIFREPVIALLYGADYSDAAAVFPVLTGYHVVFATYNILFLYFFLLKKPQIGVLTTAAGLISSFALNVLFVPRWGIAGAAWATFASGCVILLLLFVLGAIYGFRLDGRLFICLAALVLSTTAIGVYAFLPAGLVLLLTPAGLDASERSEVVRILRGGP